MTTQALPAYNRLGSRAKSTGGGEFYQAVLRTPVPALFRDKLAAYERALFGDALVSGSHHRGSRVMIVKHVRFSTEPDRSAFIKLRELHSLRDDWDGRGGQAPNASTLVQAHDLLTALCRGGVSPERVLAMPEGGVSIYCFGADKIEGGARARYAWIAIPNDPDDVACLTLTDRVAAQSTFEPIRDDPTSRVQMAALVADFLGS